MLVQSRAVTVNSNAVEYVWYAPFLTECLLDPGLGIRDGVRDIELL